MEKGLPVRIYDAKENGMGLEIGITKFDGFGWEAFEDPVHEDDMEKVKELEFFINL